MGDERVQRQDQQHGHRHVEDAQRAGIRQEAAQAEAERGPQADAREADQDEHDGHPCGVHPVVGGQADRRRGGQHHHPRLRIDPLERGGFDERHRPRLGAVRLHFARRADAPREVQQVRDARGFEDRVQQRQALERFAEAEADAEHQDRDADADAEQVRHRAAETEVDAGCEQHCVVRAGRDRRDEREQHAGGQRAEGEEFHRGFSISVLDWDGGQFSDGFLYSTGTVMWMGACTGDAAWGLGVVRVVGSQKRCPQSQYVVFEYSMHRCKK